MKSLKVSLFLFVALITGYSNAQTWSAMDTGFALPPNDTAAYGPFGVFTLEEYNNTLYAGGNFIKAGSVKSVNMAQWDGTLWDSVAGGNLNIIFALQVYTGDLMAGGALNNYLSQWNGSSWSDLGAGFSFFPAGPEILTLSIYNGNLVAGGRIDSVSGTHANNIAYWNGTNWNTFSSGLTGTYFPHGNAGVAALAIYNGNLIAGGRFDSAGGKPASNIAMWNGASWLPLGSGIAGTVSALAVYNGNLYAGGGFDSAGGKPVYNIAEWNGSAWSQVGGAMNILGEISALISYNGYLYAGGWFDTIGGIAANSIAYWNGTKWQALGKGINGSVFALLGNNNTIYAGGFFDTAGGIPALNVAMCSTPSVINEISNSSEFSVFPNPGNGKFTIHSSIISGQLSVEVYNVLGKKVYSYYQITKLSNYQFDLSSQPNGIYFYRVLKEDGSAEESGKVVIEK